MAIAASSMATRERGGAEPLARVRALLARHGLALVFAVAMGGLLVFPRWWLLATDPGEGVRVPVAVWAAGGMSSDEALEGATIRDAFDGDLPVRSPHLVNHRDDALQAGAGWQEFIGITGHVFGDPYVSLAVVTSIMGAAAFIMLYALAYHLTGSRLAAVTALPLAALMAHMAYRIDEFQPRESWRYIQPFLTLEPDREWMPWTRYLSPVLTLATLFTVVLALPRAAKTGDRRWCALAAVALALLIYSYVFYWSAMALAIGIWLAFLVVRRDYVAARRVVIVGVLAVIIALPELAMVANKSLSSTADIRARTGQDEHFGIDFQERTSILLRLLLGLPFLLALRRRSFEGTFFAALFVSPLILVGTKGLIPQQWHFRSQVWSAFAVPLFIAGAAELVRLLDPPRRDVALKGISVLACAALLYLVAFQVRTTLLVDEAFAVSSGEDAAFQWIEQNVNKSETVASPSIITTLMLDNLTPASGYIIGGYNPVVDDDELIDRYLRIEAAYGYSEQVAFDRLDYHHSFEEPGNLPSLDLQRQVETEGAYYMLYWQIFTPQRILDRIPAWRERFRQLAASQDVLAAYPADYLYCGVRERFWPAEHAAARTHVRVAFQAGDVTIYRLTDDPADPAFAGC